MKRSLIALLLLVSPLLFGQTDSGAIRVLVTDASSGAVSGAEVKLSNTATGATSSRTTGADGYATFTPIPRGNYTAEVSKTGFQKLIVNDIALQVNTNKLVRASLQVSPVSETVEVSAAADVLQSEQGSVGQVIQGSVAAELPLAARRYTQLALLVPGAAESTLNPTTRGPGWFVVNGNYQTQNNFMIDGVDNNQGTTNAQSLSAQVVQPSPDAIAEFKVQTNSYSAEFGRSSGSVVNLVLKSGGNEVHGSGWYYNRDSALAATPWSANLTGASKPDLKWNQFGGTLGGPIKKNKLFYFADYEGFLQDFGNQFLVTVPTDTERQGIFYRDVKDPATGQPFSKRTIPASRFDALGKKLIDIYPTANRPGRIASSGQTVEDYGASRPGHENTQKSDLKGDYNATDKDVFSMRWSYLRQDIFRDGIFPGIADGVGDQGAQFNTNNSFGGTWTRTFSPSVVNFFRFGYTRTYATFANASANMESAESFGFKGIPAESLKTGGLPLISVSNYNGLGTRNFRPQFQKPELFQFIDSVSIVRGRHSVRSGFETRQKNNSFLDSARTLPAYSFNGNFTGEAMADLLLGNIYQFDANTQAVVEQLQKAYAGFGQDDWKVSPNLTLNLGLRYEYTTPFYGKSPNRNINFDPATGKLVSAKSDTDYLVNADHGNWGPRVGAAWQIVPQRLVLRAGWGLFYSGEDMSGSDVNLPLNPPQLTPVTLQRIGSGPAPFQLSDPIPSNLFATYDTTRISLRAREKDYHSARVQQFNLALETQLPGEATVGVAYVGNRGSNLYANYALNQVPFGVDGSVAANRPYPAWSQITMGVQRARSWYNSLQLRFEKRMSRGWYSLAAYTFASALDEGGAWGAGSSPQYLDRFDLERGPQSQTPRQRFTFSNVYQLPIGRGRAVGASWNPIADAILGGWQISNIVTVRSGLPVNVSLAGSGVDPNTNISYRFFSRNGGGLRPDRVGNPNTGIDPKTDRTHFLDAAAFRVQAANTPGNASRNVAVGPGLFNTDVSLVKRFSIRERSSVDVRFEAFNLFNNVNFDTPNATFGSSSFGSITGAGDPRIVQTAIRFRF